jgi:hypothetical protein
MLPLLGLPQSVFAQCAAISDHDPAFLSGRLAAVNYTDGLRFKSFMSLDADVVDAVSFQ